MTSTRIGDGPGAATAASGRGGPGPIGRLARAAVLLSSLASAGCYSYAVIDPAQASAGVDVRARITPVESLRVEEQTGVSDRVIQGEIVTADSAALVLSIPLLQSQPGMSPQRLHQRVALSSSGIVELERRQLSRWRTFSLIGAAAAVVGYVVITQFDSGDAEPGTDKPGLENLVLTIRSRLLLTGGR